MSRVSSSPAANTWAQLYLGLGFTTLATLILELSLTRSSGFEPDRHLVLGAMSEVSVPLRIREVLGSVPE